MLRASCTGSGCCLKRVNIVSPDQYAQTILICLHGQGCENKHSPEAITNFVQRQQKPSEELLTHIKWTENNTVKLLRCFWGQCHFENSIDVVGEPPRATGQTLSIYNSAISCEILHQHICLTYERSHLIFKSAETGS